MEFKCSVDYVINSAPADDGKSIFVIIGLSDGANPLAFTSREKALRYAEKELLENAYEAPADIFVGPHPSLSEGHEIFIEGEPWNYYLIERVYLDPS